MKILPIVLLILTSAASAAANTNIPNVPVGTTNAAVVPTAITAYAIAPSASAASGAPIVVTAAASVASIAATAPASAPVTPKATPLISATASPASDSPWDPSPVRVNNAASQTRIYLIASSSAYDENSIANIQQVFAQQGYIADTTYLNQQPTPLGYVNTDAQRAQTLIQALTNPKVKYLWFVRGGSGALNLYPWLYAARKAIAASSPKVLIGFSDVTAIHSFINNDIGWFSVHGVLAAYNKERYEQGRTGKLNMYSSITEIAQALRGGSRYAGIEPMNPHAAGGAAGVLSGGNLTLVQSLFSTVYEPRYRGKVMMLEDTNVTAKQLDRTLHQLTYSKNFHPKAVIFGQFYAMGAAESEKQLYRQVIKDFAGRVSYPVYYYPVFGHGETNKPFILARRAEILCRTGYPFCSLRQAPVVSGFSDTPSPSPGVR